MSKENSNNSRSSFLKNLSAIFVSIFSLGIAGLSLKKLQQFIGNGYKSISVDEANNLIAKMHSPEVKQIKPELPPKYEQTSDRSQTNEI